MVNEWDELHLPTRALRPKSGFKPYLKLNQIDYSRSRYTTDHWIETCVKV
jgi:hypothetical protein